MPSNENKRFVIEMEHQMRELNQAIINPLIPPLKLSDLQASMEMTARARAIYLQEFLQVSEQNKEGMPQVSELKKLRLYREIYDELVQATQALETAITRGYLDIDEK